jgi:hypothetical protein
MADAHKGSSDIVPLALQDALLDQGPIAAGSASVACES